MFIKNRLIMGFLMFFLFTVFGVTFLLHYRVKAADEVDTTKTKSVDYEVIEKIYNLVDKEFVENFNKKEFFNGAFQGIKDILEDKRVSVKELPEFIFDEDADDVQILGDFEKQLKDVVSEYKSDEISEGELLDAALAGMLDKLDDPYTIYLDPKEYDRLNESMSGGNFTGVGIYIELDRDLDNQLTVVEPI